MHAFVFRLLLTLLCALCGATASAQSTPAASTLAVALFAQARALENGEGVARDPLTAATLYCEAARQGNADAQYNLAWMYANGRGVARHDGVAAFFFKAAAEQGIAVAQRNLATLGDVAPEMPECMRAPEPEPVPPAPVVVEVMTPVDYSLIAPKKIYDLVHKLSPRFNIEPQLALAIIAAESNFDAAAVSPKNARGLMQLIPETSERFNVGNAFDPTQNIRGGLSYLRWLLSYFEGDVALVAAAYNAGEGTVDRYKGVPPYQETHNYVQRILRTFGAKQHPFEPKVTRPSPLLRR
ncbi:MAG: lytic transglycosylase [Comamonadaceae bacterium CG17_big_fil_post_rev_8_21_14_2_50_60_13]|nr:MAG: lytic transglycosylase [Comamonadaceae bacterium CG17_big_fil_post_rev_8_21_14_2_50_60_13]